VRVCNQNIRDLKELINQMIALSEKGDAEREDTNCGVMYGILRDAAFRLLKLAEDEERAHKTKGLWKE